MKKILLLMLVLIMSMAIFASCKKNPSGQTQGGVDTKYPDGAITETSPEDGELIWSKNVQYAIIYESEDNEPTEITQLFRHLNTVVGVAPKVVTDFADSYTHRIIIGEIDSPVVTTAYQKLDRYADKYALEANGESAYLVYAEGNTLVIAYSDIIARCAAIDYICNYVFAPEFYAEGVIFAKTFNTVKYITEQRNAAREKGFQELESYITKAGVESLAKIYTLFDEELYIWLANLYDPAIGGFYYSISGRDNEGFLPDLESTAQALGTLDRSGLTGDILNQQYYNGANYKWQNFISDEMKDKLLDFAINLQASDKYFYHPQWGTGIQTSRRNRDAGWARTIITLLGGTPTYGYVSDSGTSLTSHVSANAVTQSLTNSVTSSVSVVVPTVAAEFASREALKNYLDSAGIEENSYSFFNTFATRATELRQAGLFDYAVELLCEKQKANGLWEETVSYQSVSGLMKICNFIGGKMDPDKAKAAVESSIAMALAKDYEGLAQLTFVYNPWVAIADVLPRTGSHEAALRESIKNQAGALIDETYNKLKLFTRDDGGFSMSQTHTSAYSQGAYVAIEDTPESDVNSTSIAISTVRTYMMDVLLNGAKIDGKKVEAPRLYYKYDAIYFLDTLNGLGPVEKKPYSGPMPETEKFDTYDPADGGEQNGIVFHPGPFIDINLGTEEMGKDGNYKFYHTSIVDNPKGVSGDLVLYMKSLVYDMDNDGKINGDNGQECAVNGDGSNAQFNIVNATMRGNCYVFEADMLFEDAFVSSGTAFQLMFSNGASWSPKNSTWVNFNVVTDAFGNKYLTVADNASGADGNKDAAFVQSFPAGEWVNFRIEMYKIHDTTTGKLSVVNKFFINGNYVGESDGSDYDSKNKTYQDYPINCVRLSCFRSGGASIYLDNVYAGKEQKDYVSEEINDTLHDNKVEAASRYDFETTLSNGIYAERYSTQKADPARTTQYQTSVSIDGTAPSGHDYGIFFSIVTDPNGSADKVLKITSKGANSAVPGYVTVDTAKDADKRIHVLTYNYMFVNNSAATAEILQLELLDVNGNKMGSAVTLAYNTAKSGTKEVFKMKNTTAATKFNANVWYTFRIVIDSDNKTLEYHYSTDGVEFIEAAPKVTIASSATIGALRFVCNTYNNTGVQYLDDINYAITDTAPTAKVIVSDMAAAPQLTEKVTYDFSDGLIPYATDSYKFIATSLTKNINTGADPTYIAGSAEYNNYVAQSGIGKTGDANLIGTYGAQYYVVNDPTDASNQVLQLLYRCGGKNAGGMPTNYIDIQGSKLANNVSVLEVTFDYYTDFYGWYANNFPSLVLLFWDGQYSVDDSASNRSFGVMYNPKESNGTTYAEAFQFTNNGTPDGTTNKQANAFKVSGKLLDSHTWYTFKVIVRDGKNYVYYKLRGADKFELLGSSDFKFEIPKMKYVRFQMGGYNNTSRQYLDNITYVMTDTYVDPTK